MQIQTEIAFIKTASIFGIGCDIQPMTVFGTYLHPPARRQILNHLSALDPDEWRTRTDIENATGLSTRSIEDHIPPLVEDDLLNERDTDTSDRTREYQLADNPPANLLRDLHTALQNHEPSGYDIFDELEELRR